MPEPGLRLQHLACVAVTVVAALAPRAAIAEEVSADHSKEMAASLELFKSNVRGLLVTHCLKCHGGEKTESEFDLSTREGLLKGGERGAAVAAGKPGESPLLKLIRHEVEPAMPEDGERLPDVAIEQITKWIASGAAYDRPLVEPAAVLASRQISEADRQYWAFRALGPAQPPAVKNADWCRGTVDRFVLKQLESAGVEPNGPANRRTLIRRAYFDLIGLPPTPVEVEAFVSDPAPDAYDRMVDRLLANSHYGERWARHWLDLARFAESHGYEQDYDRPSAYHYRDFVIQALNEDMAYDRFVKLQLAGDEFEPDNRLALMATGFLAAGTHATQITANQVEKERYDELDDMAATVGTAMLGLTIGCARCHDHKFDPIPQADYYRLVSTFTTTVRSEIELDFHPEVYEKAKAEFDIVHQALVDALQAFEHNELPGRFETWLAKATQPVSAKWLVLEPQSAVSTGKAKLERGDDGSYLVSGANASHDTYTFIAQTKTRGITGVRIEALSDASLPKGGPGRAANGNFALSDFQLWAAPTGTASPGAPVKLTNALATFSQTSMPVAASIDDNQTSAWAVDPEIGKDHVASFEIETPLANEQGTTLTFILKFENNTGHNLGRLRLSLCNSAKPIGLDGDSAADATVAAVNEAISTPAENRTAEQRQALASWHRTHDPDWQKLDVAVREHAAKAPKPALTKVLISTEGLPAVRLHTQGADYFEQTFYLKRGDLNQKLAPAEQGFLQVLTSVSDGARHWQTEPPKGWRTSYRRRALAEWITDTNSGAGHLLARVIVNRMWMHHFGQGIVSTPNDFGAAGAPPSHPELLDYLAGQLIRGGWKLKDLHKEIMTSAAYVQSGETDAARASVDPDNRLLWRHTRRRLEAEVIRDAMLAVSGQLDERMYGPGTLDEGQRRRSIYFTIKRSQLVPSMLLFDAPDSLQGLGQRASTIVAPQALAMLNNEQVHLRAKALAERLLARGVDPAETVDGAYRAALARPADEEEKRAGLEFVRLATETYAAAGRADAAKLAWADYCQAIFGLNEFIYIE